MRLTINDLKKEDVTIIHSGAIAEQFVGQELIAYMEPYQQANLHYWSREKRGSQAEVDYVLAMNGTIIPIEVKVGVTGSLKSLHILMQERNLPLGIRVSQQPLGKKDNILSVPLYLLSELTRIVGSALS